MRISNKTKTVVLLVLVVAVWGFVGITKLKQLTNTIYNTRIVEHDIGVSLVIKIGELKDQVVQDIKKCESAGYDEDDAIVTFDPQQSKKSTCSKIGSTNQDCYSFGTYQFKTNTVKYYYEMLHGEELTTKEALMIALDDNKAEQLTKEIVFDVQGGIFNWTCHKFINGKNRVEFIKQLEE